MLVTIPDCRRNLKITQHDFELLTICHIFNQRTILSIFLLHTGNLRILDSVVQLWGQLRKQFFLSCMEMYHATRILLQKG